MGSRPTNTPTNTATNAPTNTATNTPTQTFTATSTPTQASSGTFTITYPLLGDDNCGGELDWTTTGIAANESAKGYVSYDNGATWQWVTQPDAGDGSFSFVPSSSSTTAKLKIVLDSNSSIYAISPTFHIMSWNECV